MSSPVKAASLLGLPSELKLQIYEQVLLLDLDYVVVTRWRDSHDASYGFRSFAELNKEEPFVVPWVSLMLSCKAVAIELRAFMKECAEAAGDHYRTYVLDLEATRGGMALGNTRWRHLPCPPDQARYLVAYYDASRGFRAWGDGGPHGIMASLYQTLNHLVHCGPRFDSRFDLQSSMHFDELQIVIQGRPTKDDEHAQYRVSDRDTNPEETMISLGSMVGQINHTGVLRSSVDKIEVSCGPKALHWSSDDSEDAGIPEYWNRYGFDWGMEVYRDGEAGADPKRSNRSGWSGHVKPPASSAPS